jgi:peptidyl-dipeptidase A
MRKRILIVVAAVLTSVGATVAGPLAGAESRGGVSQAASGEERDDVQLAAKEFLRSYLRDLARLEKRAHLAEWKAANTGEKQDFEASAEASLALRKYHSDPAAYETAKRLVSAAGELPRTQARALQTAALAYRRNQLPQHLLEQMVQQSKEIERLFNTFRAELNGKKLTNNDLLEMLADENDSDRRQSIWEALKQVGTVVSGKLIELAKLRNQAASHLGFDNYWEMAIVLQEHEPDQLLAIFEELEQLTREPFSRMKAGLDRELADRFHIDPAAMMPWHYDNPFFQAAPPSAAVDLDEFYEKKAKEDITEIAREFYNDIGLPIDSVLERSDLYEREGKDQHAFCISIDRGDDVRTLCNIKPTAEWMDTMLHEQGHAVYDLNVDRRLPYNLREPAHVFTTEGVAMLFGALAKNPSWIIAYAGANPDRIGELADAIFEQRRREQLIFARWTMVMLHFEKALYEDPDQDLNARWWDYKERFQMLKRPPGRNESDWAAKPHFTIAPVYYHNYMLGELFASQLRRTLAELAGHEGPTAELDFTGQKEFGPFLKDKVLRPGRVLPWPRFVRRATGERLTAKHFASEVD